MSYDHEYYKARFDAAYKASEERLKDETADECKARLEAAYQKGYGFGQDGRELYDLSPSWAPMNTEEARMYEAGIAAGKRKFDRIVEAVVRKADIELRKRMDDAFVVLKGRRH